MLPLSIYEFPNGDAPGEPIFVPRSADAPEGDGLVIAVAYRGAWPAAISSYSTPETSRPGALESPRCRDGFPSASTEIGGQRSASSQSSAETPNQEQPHLFVEEAAAECGLSGMGARGGGARPADGSIGDLPREWRSGPRGRGGFLPVARQCPNRGHSHRIARPTFETLWRWPLSGGRGATRLHRPSINKAHWSRAMRGN
jgi:hypothetical protein